MSRNKTMTALKSSVAALALLAMTVGQAAELSEQTTSSEPTEVTAEQSTTPIRLEPVPYDHNGDGQVTLADFLMVRPGLAHRRLSAIRAFLIRIGAWLPVPLRNA